MLIILICVIISMNAWSGIMASTTRVVYFEGENDKSLTVVNTNDYPVIVQNWVDRGAGDPLLSESPFFVLPPVYYLEPGQRQGLRIINNVKNISKNEEALYWLNFFELPPVEQLDSSHSSLIVAMNTQQKLFLRPDGMSISMEEAVGDLDCSIEEKDHSFLIKCHNSSPLHISFVSINVISLEGVHSISGDVNMMLKPGEVYLYPIVYSGDKFNAIKIKVNYLDDRGGVQERIIKI